MELVHGRAQDRHLYGSRVLPSAGICMAASLGLFQDLKRTLFGGLPSEAIPK